MCQTAVTHHQTKEARQVSGYLRSRVWSVASWWVLSYFRGMPGPDGEPEEDGSAGQEEEVLSLKASTCVLYHAATSG